MDKIEHTINYFKLYDPEFGVYRTTGRFEIDSVIMTATLEYIVNTIGLPPAPASLIWRDIKGTTFPVVSCHADDYKIGSDHDKKLKHYINQSKHLDSSQLKGEIYYEFEFKNKQHEENTTSVVRAAVHDSHEPA